MVPNNGSERAQGYHSGMSSEPIVPDYGKSPGRSPASRLLRWLLVGAGVCIAGVMLLMAIMAIADWWRAREARASAIAELSKAAGSLEACKPILKQGTWATMKDGSWIAIRYESMHRIGTDLAIAVDSSGQWYESDQHFCEGLDGYQNEKKARLQFATTAEAARPDYVLRQIQGPMSEAELAPDLSNAWNALAKYGFRRMANPPVLAGGGATAAPGSQP